MPRLRMTPKSHIPIQRGPEGASETFVKGAVLVYSGGRLDEGGADPTPIVGVATEPGENNATEGARSVGYQAARPGDVWTANIDDSTDLGNGAFVDADRGVDYGIAEDADGVWYIDKGDAAAANTRVTVLECVDPVARDAANGATSRVQARVYFTWLTDTLYSDT